jgi:hypothetical protein
MSPRTTQLLSLTATLAACANGPRGEGLAITENTGGPLIRYDVDAVPLPEIPLPNNVATRLDPGSPTGRRLNISQASSTNIQREMRAKFDKMDGFGTYSPITVAFDKPLDLVDLQARHNDNTDLRDDAVFLLNVDKDCARYGEEVAVDMGRGRFPITLYGHASVSADEAAPDGMRIDTWSNSLFEFDAHATDNNFLVSETNEDRNGNGALDAGEDVDDDGVLDVANFRDPHACDGLAVDTVEHDRCVADNLLTFYERQTNTLTLRPLWPLEEQCTYAVVLSKRLKGEDGQPVVSPFPFVNHRDQTADLAPAVDLIGRYGLGLGDVAFAWTFTTGTQTKDLLALREGLYGSGVFARLADEFPVSGMHLWTRKLLAETFGGTVDPALEDDTFLPGACASAAIATFVHEGYGEWGPNMCAVEADLSSVGAWFGGTFHAPNLLVDKDGGATEAYPADNDEVFDLDLVTGEATYGGTDPTFFCALPVEDPTVTCAPGNPEGTPFCKPFPVVVFAHGYGSYRAEFAYHMGRHTQMGVAACALDSYGHGFQRAVVDPLAGAAFASFLPRFIQYGTPEVAALLVLGRDRDLNNDGLPESGADQWSADIFHTRDMVRQSALEVTQFARMLRSMDGTTQADDGRLLGDVDGDGVVDLGGPQNTLGHWGISLGGIVSGVVAGAEPTFDAVSPNAAGAGLTDVAVRSTQPGLSEAVVLPMIGQLIGACLPTDGHDNALPVDAAGGDDCWRGTGAGSASWKGGTLRLAMLNEDVASLVHNEIGSVEGVMPGDTIVLSNKATGEQARATINARGWARVGIAADALDPIEKRKALSWGDAPGPFPVDDPTDIGDPLELRVLRGDALIGKIDSFGYQVTYQGAQLEPGQPLIALQQGFGYRRNDPDIRRLLGFAQHAIAPADPAVWSQHVFLYPTDVSAYDPFARPEPTRALYMPTAGDSTVPANTGVALGLTSGLFGSWKREPDLYGPESGWRQLWVDDPRYGESKEEWLIDRHVIEGDGRLQRYADTSFNPNTVYDPDNYSDGTAEFSCGPTDWSATGGESGCPDEVIGQEVFFPVPHPAPGDELRATHDRGNGFVDAFALPLLRPKGQHGIYNAQSFRVFDADAYAVNLTSRFLATGGRTVNHEPGCDCSADAVANITLNGEPAFPGRGEQCDDTMLKLCDDTCASGWGLHVPAQAACDTE